MEMSETDAERGMLRSLSCEELEFMKWKNKNLEKDVDFIMSYNPFFFYRQTTGTFCLTGYRYLYR